MSTFCLVSGSTQNPLCWKLFIPELEKRGHQAITASLPTNERAAGGMRYAEVIAHALRGAGDGVVLVGHSASGMFVPLAASLRPFRQLVYLASTIPQPGTSIREQLASEPDMLNPEWVTACRSERNPFTDDEVALEFLFHDCPPEAMKLGLETRTLMYAEGAMTETFPLEALPAVPSAYIVCADDRTITPAWSRRTARARLGVEAIQLPGGHCPHLSRPAQLADVLHGLLD